MIRHEARRAADYFMTEKRSAPIRSHRDLEVWQTAIKLACETYRVTEGFPKREMYGLSSQMRRAAASIGSNIAEGHGRDTTLDFLRFLTISAGSLRELDTYVVLSVKLGYVSPSQAHALGELAESTGRMLTALRAALRRRHATRTRRPLQSPAPISQLPTQT